MLKNADELDAESKKDVGLSYKIATIVTDAPVKCDLKDMSFPGFEEPFREKLLSLEMYSLAGRIFNGKDKENAASPKPAKPEPKKIPVKNKDQIGLF